MNELQYVIDIAKRRLIYKGRIKEYERLANEAITEQDREHWLSKANEYRKYLEQLGA